MPELPQGVSFWYIKGSLPYRKARDVLQDPKGSEMRVVILGAGNLGTTLGLYLSRKGHEVCLWTIEEGVYEGILRGRENRKYLPGVTLPPAISITMDLSQALQGAQAVLLTVPSSAVREVSRRLRPLMTGEEILINFAKGLEPSSGKRLSEVIEEELGEMGRRVVVVSGPSIAREILEGNPTAVNVASRDPSLASETRRILEGESFRLYPTDDLIGVEVGGGFKNVFAIAAGICDGLGLGTNTKAAVVTKGMEELALLGQALGARRETLYGLSGLGDLIVTSFSPWSRNRRFGEKLAQGKTPSEAQAEIGQVVEGVKACQVAVAIAHQRGLQLPVAETLYEVIFEGLDVQRGMERFLW